MGYLLEGFQETSAYEPTHRQGNGRSQETPEGETETRPKTIPQWGINEESHHKDVYAH